MSDIDTITAQDLKHNLDNGTDLTLVETLPREVFDKEHIPGAINIPVSDIGERAEDLLPKDERIVVYCANTECDASPKAAKKLKDMGYGKVLDFEAGKQGWKDAGYELESGSEDDRMITLNPRNDLFTKTFQSVSVPALGFGTFELQGDDCYTSVCEALEIGYRHVDTARMYGNEAEVGRGIRESSVNREDIFLTSKIWREHLDPDNLGRELQSSLEDLQTEYLDLLLIHWPNPDIPLSATLDVMVEMKEKGYIRNLGVSNFPSALLKQALEHAPVLCNQVEYHPLLSQDAVLEVIREHDLMLTAYSPLAQGEVSDHQVLVDIGKQHGKSAYQVGLRWLLEQPQVVAIPRSSKPEHIQQNFDVFDFELSAEDKERIQRIPKDRRQINPDFAPEWD